MNTEYILLFRIFLFIHQILWIFINLCGIVCVKLIITSGGEYNQNNICRKIVV
jgi:hypothetical protein